MQYFFVSLEKKEVLGTHWRINLTRKENSKKVGNQKIISSNETRNEKKVSKEKKEK